MNDNTKELTFANEASLLPTRDQVSSGEKVLSATLIVDGLEQLCPYQQAIPVPPKFQHGEYSILRPPCNSRCVHFKVMTLNKTVKAGEGEENKQIAVPAVKLTCGSGTIYELSQKNMEPTPDTAPNLTRA